MKGKKAKILGTSPDMIDVAEDRKRWTALMSELDIQQPESGTGHSYDEVKAVADRIGYPVLLRPSYVLGGRGMEIIYNEEELKTYVATAVKVSKKHPVLIDKYLSHAIEIDVDVVARRRGRLHRRHNGAHRGGGRPLRRRHHGPARARPSPRTSWTASSRSPSRWPWPCRSRA